MNLLVTRNYQRSGKDVVIAVVAVPVVDIQLVVGVGIANVSDVGTNS